MYEEDGIRALNYDAWEISRVRNSAAFKDFTDEQWKEEIRKGKLALQALLDMKGELYVQLTPDSKRDVFGRPLGSFFLLTKDGYLDLGKWAQDNGHQRK